MRIVVKLKYWCLLKNKIEEIVKTTTTPITNKAILYLIVTSNLLLTKIVLVSISSISIVLFAVSKPLNYLNFIYYTQSSNGIQYLI